MQVVFSKNVKTHKINPFDDNSTALITARAFIWVHSTQIQDLGRKQAPLLPEHYLIFTNNAGSNAIDMSISPCQPK